MEELTNRNVDLKSSVMERNRLWSVDTRPWDRRPSFFILVFCPHAHRRVHESRVKSHGTRALGAAAGRKCWMHHDM